MVGSPLPGWGVTPPRRAWSALSIGATRPSSLLRTHAPDLKPLDPSACALRRQSLQGAASPCWPEVLPGVISANLSPDAWSPTPALLLVHLPVTSQETSAFTNLGTARQHAHMPYGDFCTGVLLGAADIRSCSGLWVCSPPRSLLPPGLIETRGSRGFYVRASHGLLPCRASDMLAVQIGQLTAWGLTPH